ncbi:hypothetical protein DTO96_100567 [Ephemeroptericola cinctiostellae]|uniref:Uncharacterized protein n=1 Tax=Ephemeroptericola cinctiostellae TaxID=2268024 RepID=A0A345D918_9BURK|nr:hypothetical protein DTO96_100567 [Ephemeroptericola cinctiostellae]
MIPNFYFLRGFVRVIYGTTSILICLYKQWLVGFVGLLREVFYLLHGTKKSARCRAD